MTVLLMSTPHHDGTVDEHAASWLVRVLLPSWHWQVLIYDMNMVLVTTLRYRVSVKSLAQNTVVIKYTCISCRFLDTGHADFVPSTPPTSHILFPILHIQ